MPPVLTDEKIPNNVNLAGDKRLQRALEAWQPQFIDWWKQMGPVGWQEADVYLPVAPGGDTDLAKLRQTGARGLRAILEEVLGPIMFEVPSSEEVARVVVTREAVLENVNPTIVPRDVTRRSSPREKSA